MSTRRVVLVTDGDQRAALAIVRSLGRRGHRVYVCAEAPRSLAGASRFAAGEAAVADPLAAPDAFRTDVHRLVDRWAIDTVIPVGEAALLVLLDDASLSARVPFPARESFRRISDKALLLEEASRLGIPVPKQAVVHAPTDDPPDVRFPVVAKPARSVSDNAGARVKLGAQHAADEPALRRILQSLPTLAFPVLVQERIVGPGVGIFLLRWERRTWAVFAHRRIREKPPSGGVSVYRESVAADQALVSQAEALLDAFDWNGVAMVEFKQDEVAKRSYLMEVNGRFWGSLQLALDAGVDFPSLLLDLAWGQRPEPVMQYRTGVRSRWEWGDLDHLLARLTRSPRTLALPPGAPGRARALKDFLSFLRREDRLEVFRWDDPRPFARESRAWIHALLGRNRHA
jgi:predicted ATP-grasp superfamily ATP-dependent carboligase